MGYGAIRGYLYVDGVDDIVGRIHDAIWLEWVDLPSHGIEPRTF